MVWRRMSETIRWRETSLKAQLSGAWLGSFYVKTDVSDKESFISRNLWSRTWGCTVRFKHFYTKFDAGYKPNKGVQLVRFQSSQLVQNWNYLYISRYYMLRPLIIGHHQVTHTFSLLIILFSPFPLTNVYIWVKVVYAIRWRFFRLGIYIYLNV
jgi:hypothetical protein